MSIKTGLYQYNTKYIIQLTQKGKKDFFLFYLEILLTESFLKFFFQRFITVQVSNCLSK